VYNPGVVLIMVKERQRELLEEARHIRLTQGVKRARLRFVDRLLADTGSLLISVGMRLQARCKPVVACCAEGHQPDYSHGVG
jgi:hypothetical protein